MPADADITAARDTSCYGVPVLPPAPAPTRRRRVAALVLLLAAAGCSTTTQGIAWRGPDGAGPDGSAPASATVDTATPTPHLPTITTPATPPGLPAPDATVVPGAPGAPVAGADGIGDPYYPTAGNGGYQVESYDVTLTYRPEDNELTATTVVTAEVTEPDGLTAFNLDLQPTMTVTAATVETGSGVGQAGPAGYTHTGAELTLTPAAPLEPGSRFVATIDYGGSPDVIAGGTSGLGDGGWYRTSGGGAIAAGEPFSASAYFPVNEHPSDPATFRFTITVPEGWDAAAAGDRVTGSLPAAPAGMHTVRYEQPVPVPAFLTTVIVDRLTFVEDSSGAVPILNVFTQAGLRAADLARRTPQVLQVLADRFGPYPFASYGGIYTGESLSFALETVGRPVYADWVDLDTLIHETAHQWFGNAVPIASWSDICLAECFASYAPWLYAEQVGSVNLDEMFRREVARRAGQEDFWRIPLVDMGPGNEFTSVYRRGPLALHALRLEIGAAAFDALLRDWVADRRGLPSSFGQWSVAVDRAAGRDMTPFLDAWFRGTAVPPEPYLTPAGLR